MMLDLTIQEYLPYDGHQLTTAWWLITLRMIFMPSPSKLQAKVSRLFQENPYVSQDQLNITQKDLLRWQVTDITSSTQHFGESSTILGMSTYGDSYVTRDLKLIKAWYCISPINQSPIDAFILCCYHKASSGFWFSVTAILKHHTSEILFARLAQQNIHSRMYSQHTLSADTRPFLSLFLGDNPSEFVCVSDHTYHNFFKGLHCLLYDIKDKHPIYCLINALFLDKENYLLDSMAAKKMKSHFPTGKAGLFISKNIYTISRFERRQQFQKFFILTHGLAYQVNFYTQCDPRHKKHVTFNRDALAIHSALSTYDFDAAIQILMQDKNKILQWNADGIEPCQILLDQEYSKRDGDEFSRKRLLCLITFLKIREEVIENYKYHTWLLESQEIWTFQLKQHPLYPTLDYNTYSFLSRPSSRVKNTESIDVSMKKNFFRHLAKQAWADPYAPWNNKHYYVEEILYKKPRTRMHELIINYSEGTSFLETIVQIIKRKPQYLNAKDIFGFTPLIIAVALGHLDIITLLIKHGADTRDYDFHQRRYSLLHNAPNEKVVKHLLYLGVSPHDGRLTLDQAWRQHDHERIHHLLIYGMSFYRPKHSAIIMERFEDGTNMVTHAIQAANQGATRDLESLYLLLIFFADFVYEGPYDAKIQSNSAIITIITNHNQRIQHERASKIHRALSVQSVTPLINSSRHVCGIRTRYHLINDPSYATGTVVKTDIKLLRDLSPKEQHDMLKLYDKSFQPLSDTVDFIRQIITGDITQGPWINALIEVGRIDDRIISIFVFSLQTYINEQGQLRRLFTGKVGFIDPYFSGLHLAESILRIPLAMKMDKPQVPIVETHELLMPGFGIPAMKLTLSHPSPMYQLPISSSEKNHIFLLSQGTYAMSPQPVNSVIPASMRVKIQENHPRKAWFQLLALLPREETSPEKHAVVFVSLLESFSPAFFARLRDCQRLGFTQPLLIKTARLLPAFFAYQEQQSSPKISQKSFACL